MKAAVNSLRWRYLLLGAILLIAIAFQATVAAQTISQWNALPDPVGALRNGTWPVIFILQIATPLICLTFGLYVAAVRIEDRRAWLLLGVLVVFSVAVTGADRRDSAMDWQSPFKHLVLIYRSVGVRSWAIWLMVFAVYFPERAAFDVRRPLLKWLFIGPCVALCVLSVVGRVGLNEGGRWQAAVGALQPFNARALNFLTWIPIVFFLGVLIAKARYAKDSDSRRRLRVLLAGLGLSVVPPIAFSTLVHTVLKVPEDVFGGWVQFLAYVPLAFLPVVLGYVVIVQKAFDVRVIVRQGLQYVLAKRGLIVLQLAVSSLVILGVAIASGEGTFWVRLLITALGVGLLLSIGLGGRRLAGWIDRKFFRDAYRTEQLLTSLAERVRSMVELKPLFQNVLETVSQALHVRDLGIFLDERGSLQPALMMGDGFPREEGISVPIPGRKETLGLLKLGPRLSEAPYSRSDSDLLRLVASQTAFAIENSRLTERVAAEIAEREVMQRELDIARDVQQRLFPQMCPEIPGLQYAASCRPAREVGGDYYDYFELPEGALGIAIGDVSGKGIPASLLMASLQASLRGQTGAGALPIDRAIGNVNRMVWSTSPANRYATFFYAQYETARRRMTYINAGHNAPFLFRRSGEVVRLEAGGGPPVGLFEASEYTSGEMDIQNGDVLVLYTDGMTEAMNAADEEWGEEKMIELVRRSGRDPKQLLTELFAGADAFAAGAPQHDDMTAMVFAFSL